MHSEGLLSYSGAAPTSYTSPNVTSAPAASSKAHAKKSSETHARAGSVEKAGVDGTAGGMGAVHLSTGTGVHQTATHGDRIVSGALARLLSAFPDALKFTPEDEGIPVPLEVLPDELLVFILGHLDCTALERFATVSKKARVLTLDASLWRCVQLCMFLMRQP
jgi:F-box protein 9